MAVGTWLRGLVSGGAGNRRPGTQSGEAGSFPSASAVSVNQDTALCLSAFWASIKLISESVASMPLVFYDVAADGTRTRNQKHTAARLFGGKVNRYQNRLEFFETLVMQLAMHGNSYCLKQTNSRGDLIGLLPMMSAQMEVNLKEDGGDVIYRYNNGKEQRTYSEDKIWHVKLMGNGIIGLSPLSYARNSIGIGLAADNRMGKIFGNGAKPAGVLSIDHVLKPDQRAAVKQNFNEMAQGNEDTLFVLEAGMQYTQISMSPKDVELLSSRKFQVEDVARFMGVPSVLINDTGSSTVWGSGITQIVQGFYKLGLRPYVERIEASIESNILGIEDRGNIEVEFDFNALLRADTAARFAAYKEAISGGFMKPNEARKEEGWQPEEGGDNLYMQSQNVPLNLLEGIHQKSQPTENALAAGIMKGMMQ